MYSSKLYIILLIVIILTGCTKQLDVENPNQITTEMYWKTSADARKGVNAVYSTLHRCYMSRWMLFFTIVHSDEGKSISPDSYIVNNMDNFIITDYNYGNIYGIWNDNYIGINRANQVLDNVPLINMDETLKNQCLGEARFLRAMFYYNLVSLWGNIPLMLTTPNASDLPGTSSKDKVWAQIAEDLKDAVDKLPASYESADLGRATKGAANALLAMVYMQQGKYSDALSPLEWLVDGEGKNIYQLMDNYRDNFLVTTENNKESVFEWQFAENISETTDDDVSTSNQNYGQSLAQFFAPSGIGWSDGEAQRWLVREFLKETTTTGERDPRLAASFLYDSTDVAGPDYTLIYGKTFTKRYGSNSRVWFRKFLNDHWKSVEGYRSPNNYRFIRYADVLLMYAECLNETGNTTKAYQYVDRIRKRAGLAALSVTKPNLTKASFLEQLKHERITELCGEGHRWNDLARWGDLGTKLQARDAGFANFKTDRDELLPVPQAEIDINPNLTQNPGW